MTEKTICSDKKLCDKEDCKKCFEKSFASHEKAKYWSNTNELKPNQVSKGSGKKYVFDCDCGHEFDSALNNICAGCWCPYCSSPSKKLCEKENCVKCLEKSFASHDKSKFWNNTNMKQPREILKGTHLKYKFNCTLCNHIFNTSIYSIVSLNTWCPFCANQQLCEKENCTKCFEKSFASHEKAKFFNNANIKSPRYIFKGSSDKYNFNCTLCNHIFNTSIYSIVSLNTWCPFCANQQLCDKEECKQCFEKSFASHEKAKFWSSKNDVKPRYIFSKTKAIYIFNCSICNHEFNMNTETINKGSWCQYCSINMLCEKKECKICFEKSLASHPKSKYWSNKNKILPYQVSKGSDNKYLFDCDTCLHTFEISIGTITRNNAWCNFCANRKLCKNNNCKICFEKSFASHPKSKYWSNKNELKSREVFLNDNDKYIFFCDVCNHDSIRSLCSINNNQHCLYCVIPSKLLCDNEDCRKCFERSFASHEKAKYWSSKNDVTPRYVSISNRNKYLFDCNNCNHNFNSTPDHILRGQWCPYCSVQIKKICDNEECKHCFERSFASHEKAKFWSSKNNIKSREVLKGTHNKFWFECNKKHNFKCPINEIVNGRWCPYCINKTEQKLFDQLIKNYPTLQQQFKVKWCKKKTYLPFDFVIPEDNIIIELDGPQHFMQISNWASPEETNINDKYKMECANKNNYSVIRLTQEDVFYDTYNWIDELNQNIKKIIDEKVIQNIYMCKNNEYSVFYNQSDCIEV